MNCEPQTKVTLQDPVDATVTYEMEAREDGIYFTKVHTSVVKSTIEPGVTQEVITKTKTVGQSITF